MKTLQYRAVLATVAVAIAFGVTACTGATSNGGSGDGTPQVGGDLTIGLAEIGSDYLPTTGDTGPTQLNVFNSVYDSLTVVGEDFKAHPYLAESVESNDDFTVWTVKLRPDIKLSDGTPLTADLVKRVFDQLSGDESNQSTTLAGVSAKVVDDLTLEYTLEEANISFPEVLGGVRGYVYSPDAVEAAGDAASTSPVGSGPFTLASFTADQEVTLDRNDNYWRDGMPYLDSVSFQAIPDETTRLAAFQSGQLDGFMTSDASTIAQALELEKAGQAQVINVPSSNGYAVLFEMLNSPTDDVRVRTALTAALDQDSLIAVRNGVGIIDPKNQLFGSSSPWYSDDVASVYPAYDVDEAKAQLEDYMNDPARSDGKSVGEPVSLTYTCPQDPENIDVNQAIVDSWQQVGFDVDWPVSDGSTFIYDVLGPLEGDHPFDAPYQAACWALGEQLYDPYVFLKVWFGQPAADSIVNVTDYETPEFGAALTELGAAGDPEERQAIMDRIGEMLNVDVPVAWAGGNQTALVLSPDVHGAGKWTTPDGDAGLPAVDGITLWTQVWKESDK